MQSSSVNLSLEYHKSNFHEYNTIVDPLNLIHFNSIQFNSKHSNNYLPIK